MMNLDAFLQARPWLYHLTHADNLPSLQRTRALRCAAQVLGPQRADELRSPRQHHVALPTPTGRIVVRDQRALHEGNIELPHGSTFGDYVAYLNGLVFFWPGSASGSSRLVALLGSSGGEHDVALRAPAASVLAANAGRVPLFSRWNSGAPRQSMGHRARRKVGLHVPAEQYPGPVATVVEVAFHGEVTLPADTQVAADPSGPWRDLEDPEAASALTRAASL